MYYEAHAHDHESHHNSDDEEEDSHTLDDEYYFRDHEESHALGTALAGDDTSAAFGDGRSDGDGGHPRRFIMLFYMACLNLLSDWTCYSMAPIASFIEELYLIDNPESLVVVFLYANAAATLIEPWLVYHYQLRGTVVIGAVLLAFGSVLKSDLFPQSAWKMYLSFFLIGLSQPLYQCTPALLSGNWFPPSERTMATGAALNSNQLGIGVAFFAGAILVNEASAVGMYMNVMAVSSVLLCIGVILQFESKPKEEEEEEEEEETSANKDDGIDEEVPTPKGTNGGISHAVDTTTIDQKYQSLDSLSVSFDSISGKNPTDNDSHHSPSPASPHHPQHQHQHQHYHHGNIPQHAPEKEASFFWLIRACFAQHGFFHATCAFVVSAIVVNTLSTYMDYLIRIQKHSSRRTVGIIGFLFQAFIMCASLILGKKTDESRAYYSVIMFLLVGGAFALAQCSVYLYAQNQNLIYALLVTAVLVGPLQPISTEIGVEVTYPLGENAVLCIQQLFANGCSACFIPIFQKLGPIGVDRYGVEYTFSFYVMVVLHALTTVAFSFYKGSYKRYENEMNEEMLSDDDDDDDAAALIEQYSREQETDEVATEYEPLLKEIPEGRNHYH